MQQTLTAFFKAPPVGGAASPSRRGKTEENEARQRDLMKEQPPFAPPPGRTPSSHAASAKQDEGVAGLPRFSKDDVLDFSLLTSNSRSGGSTGSEGRKVSDSADLLTPIPIYRHSMPPLTSVTPTPVPPSDAGSSAVAAVTPRQGEQPSAQLSVAAVEGAPPHGGKHRSTMGLGNLFRRDNKPVNFNRSVKHNKASKSFPANPSQSTALQQPAAAQHSIVAQQTPAGDVIKKRKVSTQRESDDPPRRRLKEEAPSPAPPETCETATAMQSDRGESEKADSDHDNGEPYKEEPRPTMRSTTTVATTRQATLSPSGCLSSLVGPTTTGNNVNNGGSAVNISNPFSIYVSSPSADLAEPAFSPDAFDARTAFDGRERLKFSILANALDAAENLKGSGTGSKKKVTVLLTNVFRLIVWLSPETLVSAVWFCFNRIAPDYEGREVGVGDAILLSVMMEMYGRTREALLKDATEHEDLGRVAELSKCRVQQLTKPAPLTICGVFESLASLPDITKNKSQDKKKVIIKKLLTAASAVEAKFLIRFLQQRLRVGIQGPTILQALAYSTTLTRKGEYADFRLADPANKVAPALIERRLVNMEMAVKRALSAVSNVAVVVSHLQNGASETDLDKRCVVRPGIPVQPMLAKPTKGLAEVFERFANCDFTCEYKYDGERAQVHVLPNGGGVQVFSRNMENLTGKYPDVAVTLKSALCENVTDLIADSEVVAWDVKEAKILPFQTLSTRKRKNVTTEDIAIQVCLFPFDCIRYNGQALIALPLAERRHYLYKAFKEIPGKLLFAQHKEMNVLEEVDAFLQDAVDANCEGLMVKSLTVNASYEPSKRSQNWLKIKKDYLENLTDSVDLVPIGAFYGKGRRHKWYGSYLLACFNPEDETFQTACKVATGFTDEMLIHLTEALTPHVIAAPDPSYQSSEKMVPDVWFAPVMCWEVRAADLSISPVHTAALGVKVSAKGIGLRFPRFIRIREDKKPSNATTAGEIVSMYESQFGERKAGLANTFTSDEEDLAE